MKMVSTIFLLAAKLIRYKARQNTPSAHPRRPIAPKISVNPPSILQPFWRNKSRLSCLCRRKLSGPEIDVFASFPLFGGRRWKVLNHRFLRKTNNFLRHLSFYWQSTGSEYYIENRWDDNLDKMTSAIFLFNTNSPTISMSRLFLGK